MDYKIEKAIQERWAYEHSPEYLTAVAVEKMRTQRARDGPSLDEVAQKFLHLYK